MWTVEVRRHIYCVYPRPNSLIRECGERDRMRGFWASGKATDRSDFNGNTGETW